MTFNGLWKISMVILTTVNDISIIFCAWIRLSCTKIGVKKLQFNRHWNHWPWACGHNKTPSSNEQDTSHNLYMWHGSLAGNLILVSILWLCLATFSSFTVSGDWFHGQILDLQKASYPFKRRRKKSLENVVDTYYLGRFGSPPYKDHSVAAHCGLSR